MVEFAKNTPEEDEITFVIPEKNFQFTRFKSYQVHKDILGATDPFSFTLGGSRAYQEIVRELEPGLRCQIFVNKVKQLEGFIDEFHIQSNHSSGTEITINGRDCLSPAVDGHIDPRVKFTKDQSLYDILSKVFEPFGITNIVETNELSRKVLTGQTRAIKVSKKKGTPLKNVLAHQLKPYPHEGAYQFAERLATRHGFHIWLGADNNSLVVSKPDFEQEALYSITRKLNQSTVVKDASLTASSRLQPAYLVCETRGGGGEFKRAGMLVIAINGYIQQDFDKIAEQFSETKVVLQTQIIDKNKTKSINGFVPGPVLVGSDVQSVELGFDGRQVINRKPETYKDGLSATNESDLSTPYSMFNYQVGPWRDETIDYLTTQIKKRFPVARVFVVGEKNKSRYRHPFVRPVFLHDDESVTLDQLENFARRKLAEFQRKAFELHYTVKGHVDPMTGIPWTPDTIVRIHDEFLGLDDELYIQSRTFKRSRTAGTETDLVLIRKHTLEFG